MAVLIVEMARVNSQRDYSAISRFVVSERSPQLSARRLRSGLSAERTAGVTYFPSLENLKI